MYKLPCSISHCICVYIPYHFQSSNPLQVVTSFISKPSLQYPLDKQLSFIPTI